MNLYQRMIFERPSVIRNSCVICGQRATNNHHVIPRSAGGADGPRITLCGMGNASGCHGLAHSGRLHFRWWEGWRYALTEPMKYDVALDVADWREIV